MGTLPLHPILIIACQGILGMSWMSAHLIHYYHDIVIRLQVYTLLSCLNTSTANPSSNLLAAKN